MEKKKCGSVLNILPVFLGIIAITILSLMYIYYVKDMDVREQAGQIARQYMLEMESTGYMTEDAQSSIIEALKAIGMNNINLSGTTMTEAGYGNEIVLVINAKAPVTEIAITDYLNPVIESSETDFKVVLKSTAKN